MNQSWALIGNKAGTVLLGHGPFTSSAFCPPKQTAFYHNSFSLSHAEPWLIPSRTETVPLAELPERLGVSPQRPDPPFEWSSPCVDSFRDIFDEISHEISHGSLQKSVPVVTEEASATERQFLQSLSALPSHHKNLMPYGLYQAGQGFLGATPELLFHSFEGKLATMALAGTARPEDYDVFVLDQKEIQEHEFVVTTLQETLSRLGMTRRLDRSILHLGSLIHFHTPIEVELYNSQSLDTLVRALHPTPALGPLPRSERHLQQLSAYRARLGCPESFGAPFGCYHEGHFRAYVAIRMIHFSSNTLKVPAGCGIISASRLTSEWQELALKRQSVKALFDLP